MDTAERRDGTSSGQRLPTVLILNLTYGKAGMENQILSFLRWARDIRQHFVYVGVRQSYPLSGASGLGFTTAAIPRSRFREITIIRRLREWVRRYQITLIHAHAPKASVLAGLAALGSPRLPVVTTIHNCHLKELQKHVVSALPGLYSLAALQVSRLFGQRFVAVSGAVRKDLLQQRIPEGCITVVDNGVEIDRFDRPSEVSSLRAALGIGSREMVIGTVGRLDKLKGHDILLRALKRIVTSHPFTKLMLVGTGPQKDRLHVLAAELGIEDRVLFLGHRDDVPELLQLTDVFVFPSLEEGFGLSLVEAMASGKPVVATDIEAVREIAEDGVTGLLYPPHSHDALADALEILLTNPEWRLQFGRAGHQVAARRYSVSRYGSQLLELYRQEVQENTGRTRT